VGYGPNDDTWEPAKHVDPRLVAAYATDSPPHAASQPHSTGPMHPAAGATIATSAAPIAAAAASTTPIATTASASAPGPASASTGADQIFVVGALVRGRHMASSLGKFGTKWWPATVQHIRPDGTCDLLYEDGDFEEAVQREFVKPRRLPI
jgi:hypothetical protein